MAQRGKAEGSHTSRTRAIVSTLFDLSRNVALLLVLYLAYAAVRRLTADQFTVAFANARRVVAFQDAVGLPSETALQAWFIDRPEVVKAANRFYMGVHFPATALFLLWAWFKHRAHFGIIRTSLIVLTVSGLFLHLVFPLAPPRKLTSQGFVDTGLIYGPSPYDLASASKAANQIAAMPSLHVGWALLIAISVISLSSSRWRLLILTHPIVTTMVVVMTANHYWVDAIIASLLVLGSWVFVTRTKSVPALGLSEVPTFRDITREEHDAGPCRDEPACDEPDRDEPDRDDTALDDDRDLTTTG